MVSLYQYVVRKSEVDVDVMIMRVTYILSVILSQKLTRQRAQLLLVIIAHHGLGGLAPKERPHNISFPKFDTELMKRQLRACG